MLHETYLRKKYPEKDLKTVINDFNTISEFVRFPLS
jgi:hypothetical protein